MVDQRLALHLIILVQAALLSSAFNSSNDGSHDSGCAGYSRAFAENVGEVITCIANHTSPMSYCGSCQRLLNRLHHIVTDNISASQDGVLCAELVLPVSELMPTYNALKFIIDIWDSSSCSKCLTDPVYFDLKFLLPSSSSTIDLHHFYENLVKGAKRFDVSAYPSEPTAYNNLTQRFFQLLDKTITCFNLYINYSASSLLDSFNFPGVDLIEPQG
ncbi:unnamed protein product [Protopolystoma xenopodis]|uniref:Saposin B-type domain-containing protein n=1 Tax=Protopolystoma xenopodis TaxID=117903 RepID=A0A448WNV9_9PLAT|nr:unnamed protein product [Protopolystoma xenopodis]